MSQSPKIQASAKVGVMESKHRRPQRRKKSSYWIERSRQKAMGCPITRLMNPSQSPRTGSLEELSQLTGCLGDAPPFSPSCEAPGEWNPYISSRCMYFLRVWNETKEIILMNYGCSLLLMGRQARLILFPEKSLHPSNLLSNNWTGNNHFHEASSNDAVLHTVSAFRNASC